MPRKMVPDGAALELFLGMHGRSRSGEQQPAGCGAQPKILFLAVGRQQRAFGPGVGIRAGQPVVPVDAGVGIGVKLSLKVH